MSRGFLREAVEGDRRTSALAPKNAWYVSSSLYKPLPVRTVRTTRTFASEAEARHFVRIKIEGGHKTLRLASEVENQLPSGSFL
jgi:hypothetical protein